jgi:hypothetical protein
LDIQRGVGLGALAMLHYALHELFMLLSHTNAGAAPEIGVFARLITLVEMTGFAVTYAAVMWDMVRVFIPMPAWVRRPATKGEG